MPVLVTLAMSGAMTPLVPDGERSMLMSATVRASAAAALSEAPSIRARQAASAAASAAVWM